MFSPAIHWCTMRAALLALMLVLALTLNVSRVASAQDLPAIPEPAPVTLDA